MQVQSIRTCQQDIGCTLCSVFKCKFFAPDTGKLIILCQFVLAVASYLTECESGFDLPITPIKDQMFGSIQALCSVFALYSCFILKNETQLDLVHQPSGGVVAICRSCSINSQPWPSELIETTRL